MRFPDNYPELLSDLAIEVSRTLREHGGVDAARADEIGFSFAEKVRGRWGGISQYIPKGDAVDLARRDWEIYAKCDGTNFADLAAEYDLSEVRIRQIVKACHAEDQRRRQKSLL